MPKDGNIHSTCVREKLTKGTGKTRNMTAVAFDHKEFMVIAHGEKISFDIECGKWVYTS